MKKFKFECRNLELGLDRNPKNGSLRKGDEAVEVEAEKMMEVIVQAIETLYDRLGKKN